MSILLNRDTKVIIQGFTGKEGTFYVEQSIISGTAKEKMDALTAIGVEVVVSSA